MSEGTCKIVPRAEYQIIGRTMHDQDWIDDTIEGEVGGCGFERPKARPPEWDNAPPPGGREVTGKKPPAPSARRPGLLSRARASVSGALHRTPAPTPTPTPEPGVVEPLRPAEEPVAIRGVAAPEPPTPPAPPPRVRKVHPSDELLGQ